MKLASSTAKGLALGALVGPGLFALQAALIGPGSAGLAMDNTEGPFAALFRAVRPLLPALLIRIAVVYVVAGAALGAAAGALAALWAPRRVLPIAALELAVLWLLIAWGHAI